GDFSLLTGSSEEFKTRDNAIVWLLGDRLAYPGAIDRKSGTFFAAIPYNDFARGDHTIRIFLTHMTNGATLRAPTILSFDSPERGTPVVSNYENCNAGAHLLSGA
ncbi:MAG: hypothetical protein JO263_06305, partial [Candidatus Eremiobacteraeota bacterium]|nr:hypothetical protein [Candidatus Eremiobacteraeota bacterium]